MERKAEWVKFRQLQRACECAFDDLHYLKQFVHKEEGKITIRCKTIQKFRSTTEHSMQEIPESSGFMRKLSVAKSAQFIELVGSPTSVLEQKDMDVPEFLIHMNLQLQMNLDHAFLSGIKEIINFFASVEKFMIDTFGNSELEIKIDMMRLIVRMTNAVYFVDKIYMLDLMRIPYLDNWQTFALFVQVVYDEVDILGKRSSRKQRKSISKVHC